MHKQYARYPMCNDSPDEVPNDGEDIARWRYELEAVMRSDGIRVLLTAKRVRLDVEERLLDWQGSATDALGMIPHSVLQDMMVVLGETSSALEPAFEAIGEEG